MSLPPAISEEKEEHPVFHGFNGTYQYVLLGSYPWKTVNRKDIIMGNDPYSSGVETEDEPVLWRILALEDGTLLLLTEYVIELQQVAFINDPEKVDSKKYEKNLPFMEDYSVTDLCRWMNTDMFNRLFGADPIVNAMLAEGENGKNGRLFCMSDVQFCKSSYGWRANKKPTGVRVAAPTPYTLNRRIFRDGKKKSINYKEGGSPYWCSTKTANYRFQIVGYDGHLSAGVISRENIGLRPAIRLDVNLVDVESGKGTKKDPFILKYTGTLPTVAPESEEESASETSSAPDTAHGPEEGKEPEASAETLSGPDEKAGAVTAPDPEQETEKEAEAAEDPEAEPDAEEETAAEPEEDPEEDAETEPEEDPEAEPDTEQKTTDEPEGTKETEPALIPEPGQDQETPEEGSPEDAESAEAEDEEDLPEVTASKEGTAVISFLGDCSIGDALQSVTKANSFHSVIDREGYGWPFSEVQDYIGTDDMTVGNLEVVITTQTKHKNIVFPLRADPDHVNVLLESSIDVVSTANNHCYDFHRNGYVDTLQALDDAGIDHFGSVYYSRKDGFDDVVVKDVNGIRIGLFGFTYPTENDLKHAETLIAKLRDEEHCDYIIASLHWGRETHLVPGTGNVKYAQKLLNLGADMIYGHHPHVLQPVAFYNNKPVLFSMGNGTFGTLSANMDQHAAIVQLTLEKTAEGTVPRKLEAIPCKYYKTGDYRLEEEGDDDEREKTFKILSPGRKLVDCVNPPDSFLYTGVVLFNEAGEMIADE